jgi:hypothetical protein
LKIDNGNTTLEVKDLYVEFSTRDGAVKSGRWSVLPAKGR